MSENSKGPVCELCGDDPVCCKCVVEGLTAKAEATIAHEKWREKWSNPKRGAVQG